MSLAGPAINYELGLFSGIGCDADAFEALGEVADEDEFEAAFIEAQVLVQDLRAAIDVVADRVLTAGAIEGSEIEALIEAHG